MAVKTRARLDLGPPPASRNASMEEPRETLRDAQKRRTRRKLLAAGKQLFAHGGYMTCRVDEIAATAGISRAAFYLHYKTKQALLADILDHEMRLQWRRLRRLRSESTPSLDQLVTWIEGFVRGFSAGRDMISLFNFAVSIDPQLQRLTYVDRQRTVLLLSRQVPAFSVMNAAGELDAERNAGLHLLLFEMEQLCVQIALGFWTTDPKVAIRTVAAQFLEFGRASGAA